MGWNVIGIVVNSMEISSVVIVVVAVARDVSSTMVLVLEIEI